MVLLHEFRFTKGFTVVTIVSKEYGPFFLQSKYKILLYWTFGGTLLQKTASSYGRTYFLTL